MEDDSVKAYMCAVVFGVIMIAGILVSLTGNSSDTQDYQQPDCAHHTYNIGVCK